MAPGQDGMNAAQRHLKAIAAGVVTKTNVIGIRKALAHVDRLRMGYSGNRSNVTREEADAIEQALLESRPTVTGELVETGKRLLQSPRYAKRLADFAPALARIDHFRLIRFDRVQYQRGLGTLVPVYAVWAKVPPCIGPDPFPPGVTYEVFVFRNVPWQSGGNGPEIQGRDF